MKLAPIFLFVFLIPVSFAQTSLQPGQTTFEVPNIIIPPSNPSNDFTPTGQTIALYGDLSYLNIKWTAYYSDGISRPMGIDCYLNCPNPAENIDANCASYKNNTNYCNFVGGTGSHFCTIGKPNYLFKQLNNNVTCKFYNPSLPDIKYLPYPSRDFKPLDYRVFTEKVTLTVGESFVLPINIRPIGLMTDSYTSNVSVADHTQANLVILENVLGTTDRLRYNQVGITYPKVTFLSSQKVNLKLLVKSNTEPTVCSTNNDCIYFGDAECVDSACWKKNIIESSAGKVGLPEFGLFGILQIVFLASLVFIFLR